MAALVLVLWGGSDDPSTETAGGDPRPSATETQTETPDDSRPGSDSDGDEPPPEPTNTQTVAPTLEPVATAVPTNTSVPPPPPGPPASTSTPVVQGPTAAEIEAERSYRVKASAQLLVYINRFNQYWGLPSLGYKNDVLEYGGIAGAWANQMAGFEPAPPRFRQAHDQMRNALYAFDDQGKKVVDAFTQAELDAWFAIWDRTFDDMVLAYDDYLLVVGISLPDLVRAP